MKKTMNAEDVRRKAKARVASRRAEAKACSGDLETKRLLHELQVHQIELEAQNEELRQANTEISEHKERLRNIIKNTPAGYFHIDREGRFLDVNDAWLHMHGYDSAYEVIGKHFRMMQVDGSSDSALAHLEELQRGVSIPHGEFCSRHKDGSVGHHIFSAHPVERMGTVAGFEWFIIDITERKLNEKALRVSERRFRSVFDHSPVGKSITTMDGTIRPNAAFCRTVGYSVEELNKLTWQEITHPDDIKKTTEIVNSIIAKGKGSASWEKRYTHKDGHTVWVDISTSLYRDSNDNPLYFITVIIDISGRKRDEREKAKLEGQLQQVQKIESIGQLAGGVAHDFNNMLGVILGHTELALRKADSASPFISDLEEIRKAANHSADLTRQLLTFARKQVISPKVLDLNEAVTGTLKMLQRLIGENIQLSWNPAANLWPVKIDPSQVNQILANLFVNARDAISGTGKISIKTENSTLDENATSALPYDVLSGDYVRISVSDDGCGMDKKAQAHIFEPFYTTKEVGSGTGLGLATVYGAVKQNGGFLTVYSEPGLGTVFNIYLPRTSKAVEAKQETVEKSLLRGTETILLVEDDEMLLSLVTTMLEESGYTVLAAATTVLAQNLAKDHTGPIHLLVSDMIMPVMNGSELSARLQPLRPDMKVLFLSGYTDDIISNQGIIKEDIHFLQKPFSLEALTAKVREVLDDH